MERPGEKTGGGRKYESVSRQDYLQGSLSLGDCTASQSLNHSSGNFFCLPLPMYTPWPKVLEHH